MTILVDKQSRVEVSYSELCKRLIKNTIFIGTFKEKRFVEPLGDYRDVVTVKHDEKDFIENLNYVRKTIDRNVLFKKWIGITTPTTIGSPVGYNLWVNLSQEIFGTYFFIVKNIDFKEKEISVKLDVIRPYEPIRQTPDRVASSTTTSDFPAVVRDFMGDIWEGAVEKIRYFYNFANLTTMKELFTFLSILTVTIVIGGFNFFKWSAEYFLVFLKVITNMIKASQPVVVNIINGVVDIVLGIIRALEMCFRRPDNILVITPDQAFNAMQQRGQNRIFSNRAITYYGR